MSVFTTTTTGLTEVYKLNFLERWKKIARKPRGLWGQVL